MSFYFSQNPILVPHDIYLSCLLRLPLAVILPQTFLYSDDLDSFEDGLVGFFVICPCIEIYLMFSYDYNRICGLGEKITEAKYYSHHVTSRALAVTRICQQWPHPWLRGEGYLSGFSSVKLLALPFCPVPLGASPSVQLPLGSYAPSRRAERLCKLFPNFLQLRFVSSVLIFTQAIIFYISLQSWIFIWYCGL